MKKCDQIKPFLIDFVDKSLDRENTEMVSRHLENCQQCHEEVDGLVVIFGEMDKLEDEIPDESLSKNFKAMLEAEKLKSGRTAKMEAPGVKSLFYSPFGQIAAAVAILVTGIFLGLLFNNQRTSYPEVAQLKDEVRSMKDMLILSKLDQPVASERIMAASYLMEMTTPDREVLEALIHTFNTDKNSNVRQAAMNALSKFRNNPLVADAFVEGLSIQTDPIIQISLINILVDMQDTRAVDKMKQIISNQSTNESVKKMAEQGIITLI